MPKTRTQKKAEAPTKSATAVAKSAKSAEAPLATKPSNGSPYQLDGEQVQRAATSLVAHMKKHAQEKEEKSGKKNLVADEDEPEQSDAPIFLTVASKQVLTKDDKRLKMNKIVLPHPLQGEELRICLIVKDPQREYKDLVADDAFPENVRNKVQRVIGVDKLKKKYKTYETRRQLLAEYDLFLADDRVVDNLSKILGSSFYKKAKSKRPLPVSLSFQTPKDKDGKRPYVVKKPKDIAQEIENALRSTLVQMTVSRTASIRVGNLSQTPQQIQENVEAAVSALVNKFITNGWRNIDRFLIKGPATVALPIWASAEAWEHEGQVLEEAWKPEIKDVSAPSEKKRKFDEWAKEMLDDDEYAERQAKIREAKKSKGKHENSNEKETQTISRENRKKLKKEALQSVQTPLIAG
ncbi:ribosomal protein L1p/L10e family-domain-containing protein [Dendryphion nanum]|uniref:Ribosomal protein L1p/L10e family-domain-containing protein n=1 Tax=Dendryphion nanum TaxID=256645 RepID=A0A9P9IPW8_9PLEO|nr:ribosomal protein L1p/L10e family-domain-containing protein [Dendryphion nanum]